jgi:hypothetical protein
VGDPCLSCVDKVGSGGSSAGGAVEAEGSPAVLLLQARVLSGDGTPGSSVVARLLLLARSCVAMDLGREE